MIEPLRAIRRFQLWRSYKTTYKGLRLVFPQSENTYFAFRKKLEAAIDLVERHVPVRFAYMQRDVRILLVDGLPTYAACWHEDDKSIEFNSEYLANEHRVGEIALTLVHEATHARLHRLGFDYSEDNSLRVERTCIHSERVLARRMEFGEQWAAACTERRDSLKAERYTTRGHDRASIEALREMGTPKWLIRWLWKRRYPIEPLE